VSLKDALIEALPGKADLYPEFDCKVHYIHTPPKPCDPLFSTPLGYDPEKTRLASHFLTVSVGAGSVAGTTGQLPKYCENQQEGVFGIGIEVLVYSSKYLTTLFVSKADTTGYIPSHPPSRTKTICKTFLIWLTTQERQTHPSRKVVVSLFARSQSQYLFPGSIEHSTKHVLDDRQLIKWWAKVLDPLLDLSKDVEEQAAPEVPADIQGYLTVPGYDRHELRAQLPRTTHGHGRTWSPGNPLRELAKTRGAPEDAPARCLLPRFPDDPKARFIQELDDEVGLSEDASTMVSQSKRRNGQWNNIRDLDRFWEAMEFRQECSSGRVVGFLWIVIAPSSDGKPSDGNAESQESSQGVISSDPAMLQDMPPTPPVKSSPKKRKRKPLSGPIIPRKPRLKGGSSSLTATSAGLNDMVNGTDNQDGLLLSKDAYDQAMQTLLHLDFAHLEVAARSTAKWVHEVMRSCGLSEDFALEIAGTAKPTQAELAPALHQPPKPKGQVNDLGGMVRKKRKAGDEGVSEGHAVAEARAETDGADMPAVNVLGAGMMKKKPKPSAS